MINDLDNIYMQDIRDNNKHISIYLISGVKLSGWIKSYDQQCVIIRDHSDSIHQLIYKHAISTIMPIIKREV